MCNQLKCWEHKRIGQTHCPNGTKRIITAHRKRSRFTNLPKIQKAGHPETILGSLWKLLQSQGLRTLTAAFAVGAEPEFPFLVEPWALLLESFLTRRLVFDLIDRSLSRMRPSDMGNSGRPNGRLAPVARCAGRERSFAVNPNRSLR